MFIATDFIWGQHVSELTSKAIGAVEVSRCDLSFALRYTKAAAYDIFVELKHHLFDILI